MLSLPFAGRADRAHGMAIQMVITQPACISVWVFQNRQRAGGDFLTQNLIANFCTYSYQNVYNHRTLLILIAM